MKSPGLTRLGMSLGLCALGYSHPHACSQGADKQAYVEMVFRLANGKDAHVSKAGLHILVRMNGRAYDAYTGAAGLPWADYMSRLGAVTPIVEKVVVSP